MYNLNASDAKAAEQIGRFIRETGKYQGTITRAEAVKSKSGTDGIEFTFVADDGREAEYLQLWTMRVDGSHLPGYKLLMAIMACCKVKTLTPSSMMVKKYSRDAGAKVDVQITGFPELTGKKVGFLLQKEIYPKQDKSQGSRVLIYAAFQYGTELTAAEILESKTTPSALGKLVEGLHDRDSYTGKVPADAGLPAYEQASTSATTDFDDDIPF